MTKRDRVQMAHDAVDASKKMLVDHMAGDRTLPADDLQGVTVCYHFLNGAGLYQPVMVTYAPDEIEPTLLAALQMVLSVREIVPREVIDDAITSSGDGKLQ